MAERISFVTNDDVEIVGDWQAAPTLLGGAVLVHSMTTNRDSWAYAQRVLSKRGIATLAIDLRGHGESTNGPDGSVLNFTAFADADHQSSIHDVIGAVRWLRDKGLSTDRIFVVGASIGANLAIQMLTEEPRMPGAVLLSAGKQYRGIDAFEDAQNLLPAQALYIVAAEDDAEAFKDSQQLYAEAPVNEKSFQQYKVAGHGTAIMNADSTLADKIADWMLKHLTAPS